MPKPIVFPMMKPEKPRRPTKIELEQAVGGATRDVLAPNLKVVFCGINPSVYSVVVGHHFARPGNRFWPALFNSGFTPRLFAPDEDQKLLEVGLGITNVAARATVAAADLFPGELEAGGAILRAKIEKLKPKFLAVLGIGAFRVAFGPKDAVLGLQDLEIGETRVWVLPNPSGLNAHYKPSDLAQLFREFRGFVEEDD